jgi:three-Cys-motif partner protein
MASDGYVDREQSQIKHLALAKYLDVAARIIGQSRDIAYIDCCAGPWGSQTPDYSDTSFGVAIDALRKAREFLLSQGRNPKFRVLLIEKDPAAFAKLKVFAEAAGSPGITVRAENWDFTEHIDEILAFAREGRAFPFAFIDPKGWKLARINVIRPLLQLEPGEALVNLMSSFVTRFVNDENQDFTNLLGENFEEVRNLEGSDQEDEVVHRYCEAVRKVGRFRFMCALPVMKPDQDAFHFHLIYATRHPLGVEKFKEVEKTAERQTEIIRGSKQQRHREQRSGTPDLFPPEVLYRETRYQRLREKNNRLAEAAVLNLIRTRKRVDYKECWAEALQFATVHQNDLRGWLSAWELQGLIRVEGRKKATEKLSRSGTYTISVQG